MNAPLISALAFVLLTSHPIASGETVQRTFNTSNFYGLVTENLERYEDAELDYELEGVDGAAVVFKRCTQVEATNDADVTESQFGLLQILRMNCLALKRFSSSSRAQRSFFPRTLTRSDVAAFPASATVHLSAQGPHEVHNDRELSGLGGAQQISLVAPDHARIEAANEELHYRVMARADFDDDGTQDLLVRVDWRALDATGRGSDLIILSRHAHDAPVHLIWRR